MKKRALSFILALAMILPIVPVTALAATTYNTSTLLVVNTSTATEADGSPVEGTVTVTLNTVADPLKSEYGGQNTQGVQDIYVDEETGKTMTVLEPDHEDISPVAEKDGMIKKYQSMNRMEATYYSGSTKTIVADNCTKYMKCLYVGTYCTVWNATNDNSNILLSTSQAKQIGQEFDSNYSKMKAMFGTIYDADGDGKVAIFCHDIDNDYGAGSGSYVAGYFYVANMINSSGYINGFNFGTHSEAYGMDCIHLDTSHAMGTNLSNISNAYSTLYHELQHGINFSYAIAGSTFLGQMETYLDEAFAMAAEHQVCGASSVANRVEWFSDVDNYTPGWPLTYWHGDLDNYANSYLFGQYIRTRYAQQVGGDGSGLFKAVLSRRTSSNTGIDIVAGLLNTTSTQLLKDFWSAVYYKNSSGVHGFNGESWANSIQVVGLGGTGRDTLSVYNGGALFLWPDDGTAVVQSSSGVAIISLDSGATPANPSGTCGSNARWYLNISTGKLSIFGSGAMTDYTSAGAAPWYAYKSYIKTVDIYDGVTSIGSCAFSECYSLTTVEIPNSVTSIGDYAFYYCTSLTSAEIPDSVTSIGEEAFSNCITLTTVEIGDGVTSIGDYAFGYCGSLTTVEIGDSVTSIGSSAFRCCNSLTTVEIPDSVTSIGSSAFRECSSLTTVEIPDSVTSISNYAFSECTSLASVKIPGSVTSIGDYAFYNCGSLTDVYYYGTMVQWNSITVGSNNTALTSAERHYMVETASGTCGSDVRWDLDTSTGKLTISGTGAMNDYTEESSSPWYDYRSFIKTVDILDGVTSIGSNAFKDCTSLTSVEIGDSVTSIGGYAFSSCNMTAVEIPDSVTSIGSYAFAYCRKLTAVEIPNSVTSIGGDAFIACDSLSTVKIGNSVTNIGNSVMRIGEYAFSLCGSLTTVEIGDSVRSIGGHAFWSCKALTTVEIGDSVTSIGDYAFSECTALTTVEFGDSVTSIGSYAFKNCSSLTSVEIPDGVTSIGFDTFSGCTSLTYVEIPASVTSIKQGAFGGCSSLTDVYYYGTMVQWNSITVGSNNTALTSAECHYMTKSIVNNHDRTHTIMDICSDCGMKRYEVQEDCADENRDFSCDTCGNDLPCEHAATRSIRFVYAGSGVHNREVVCDNCDAALSSTQQSCTVTSDGACDVCGSGSSGGNSTNIANSSDARLRAMSFGPVVSYVGMSDVTGYMIYPWTYNSSYGRVQSGKCEYRGSASTMTLWVRTIADATLSFNYGVSSSSYDKLTITVDGSTVVNVGGSTTGSYTQKLSSGSHTVEFEYKLGSYYSSGTEIAWFRNLKIDGCVHGNASTTYAPADNRTHTVLRTCADCDQTLLSTTQACADGDKDFVCDLCGGDLPCLHPETGVIWTPNGNRTHTKVKTCSECGETLDLLTEPCSDCDVDFICDTCGGDLPCEHTGQRITQFVCSGSENHRRDVFCAVCDTRLSSTWESCKDENADGACDLCDGTMLAQTITVTLEDNPAGQVFAAVYDANGRFLAAASKPIAANVGRLQLTFKEFAVEKAAKIKLFFMDNTKTMKPLREVLILVEK